MPTDPAPAVPALALSLKDAARSLSVCERTAWGLIHSGRLAHVRIGVRIIVPVAEIAAFLQREARTQATPPPVEMPAETEARP